MTKPVDIDPLDIRMADLLPVHANPRAWTARKSMGRVRREEAKALGWERHPDWVGRPGKGLTPFQDADPRIEPEDCTHSQIKDLDSGPGPVSRCLDCGCLIKTAKRELADEPDEVDDETLDDLRQRWNNAHWGAP